jgi:hypothetical protein
VVAQAESGSGALTLIQRDPKGRILRVDGPDVGSDANLLELAYDARDLRLRIAQPMAPNPVPAPVPEGPTPAPTWQFTYDANGDLFEETLPRPGHRIRSYRDPLGRVVLTDYGADNTPASPGPEDWVYTYYPMGYLGAGQLETVSGRNGIEGKCSPRPVFS